MLREQHPIAYEQGVAHWHRSDGREGIEPLPDHLDEDLSAFNLAGVLNVPAADVWLQPLHLLGSAVTKLRTQSLIADRDAKKRKKKK